MNNFFENTGRLMWLLGAGLAASKMYKPNGEINYAMAGITGLALYKGVSTDKKSSTAGANTPDAPLPSGSESNLDIIKISSISQQLYGVLSSRLIDARQRCTAYERYYDKTSNAEFIAVHNKYKNDYGKTIREAMSETYQSGCSIFYTQWNDKVLLRMNSLNI